MLQCNAMQCIVTKFPLISADDLFAAIKRSTSFKYFVLQNDTLCSEQATLFLLNRHYPYRNNTARVSFHFFPTSLSHTSKPFSPRPQKVPTKNAHKKCPQKATIFTKDYFFISLFLNPSPTLCRP